MKLKKSISSSLALCLIASSMSFIGSTNVASAASKLISTSKAKQIMLKKVPNGKFTEFKLDNDRTPTYEAEIVKGNYEYDITVDAITGKVLEFEKEKTKVYSGKIITEKKAKEIMLKKVPNGTFIESKLDKDNTPTYEAEIVKGSYEYDITVDARNGKVLEFEKEKTISITSLKLNAKSANVQKGKTTTLKATVAPTNAKVKDVKWTSSNTKIATVSSKGVVKGIKAGTVTITATSNNGKKATCKVTVKNAKVVGEKKAKQVVLDRVPGAKFISFEFDYDDYTPTYEVEVTKGNYKYEISIDAITGKIIRFETERYYNSSSSSSTLISAVKAKQIMLNKVPGARIVEFELDRDDYIPTYEGTLRKGIYEYEITVNAKTGKIIKFEKDID